MSQIDNLYLFFLKEYFESVIADGYEIKIDWYTNYAEGLNQFNDKTIMIVVTKNPSISYGSVQIESLYLSAVTPNKNIGEAMRIFELFQQDTFNKKKYIGTSLAISNFYSPSLDQNFLNLGLEDGAEITMQGTVVFNENVNDIKSIKYGNEEIEYLEVVETAAAVSIPQQLLNETGHYNPSTKSLNQSRTYELMIRLVPKNTLFCNQLMLWKYGSIDVNTSFEIKITQISNNIETTKTMIVKNVTYSYAQSTPSLVVTLNDKLL